MLILEAVWEVVASGADPRVPGPAGQDRSLPLLFFSHLRKAEYPPVLGITPALLF